MPSERMKIMADAEWAKEIFMTEPPAGRRLFEELLDRYSKDGMVCFRFAEGLESLGEIAKASEYFRRARDLFFMKEWQTLAIQGIERCKLHQRLSKLPKGIGALWKDVLSMYRSPFRARAVVARASAERTVEFLAQRFRLEHEEGLDRNLKLLKKSRKFRREFIEDLELIQKVGNSAAHGADLSEGEYRKSFEASERIVDFLVKETYPAR